MSKSNPTAFPDPERGSKSVEALEKARSLPPGKERTDALMEAGQRRNAAVAYRQISTDESRSTENE
jgi:hypothetical protein